jgi:hypothetical protein
MEHASLSQECAEKSYRVFTQLRLSLTNSDNLQRLLQQEKENSDGFEALPRRFVEVSKVLLDV